MAVNSLLYFLLATGLTTPPEESVTTESNYDIVTRFNYGPTREEALYRTHRREVTPGDFISTEYTTEDPHDEFVTPVTRGEEDSEFWPFNKKKPTHRTTERPKPPPHTKSDRDDRTPEGRTERPQPPPHTKSEADSVFWPFHRKRPHRRTERPEPHTKSDRDYTTPEYRTERPEPPPHTKSDRDNKTPEYRTEWPEPPPHTKSEKDGVYWPYDNEEETEQPVDETDDNIWSRATEEPEDVTRRPKASHSAHHKKGKRPCPEREHLSSKCDKFCDKDRNCEKKNERSCVCDGPLVRHENGTCVSREACGSSGKQKSEDQNRGDCPDNQLCDVECVRNGDKRGHCEGENCICEKYEAPKDRDPDDCHPFVCQKECLRRGQKVGSCEGNTCKCQEKEESVDSGCNLQECTINCLTNGKGPGKCEGDTCKCYVESSSQDKYCPNEGKCKEHCMLNGRDGICQGGICMCWLGATEPPQDSDSYYCHPSSCNKECFAFGHGAGKCEESKCKCERG